MLLSSLIKTIVVQYGVNAVKNCSMNVSTSLQKVTSNGKYLKRDHVTALLRDLKWINLNSIMRLKEASFMYKNLYVSADSNVKKY